MIITRKDSQNRPYTIQIDRRDLALYRSHKWQRHTKGLIRYAGEKKGNGCVLLHRAIMGVGPELYILHRNGDKFDCRRENLEVITFQEQRDRKRCPRKPYFNTRSRTGALVGVTIQKTVHRWANGHSSTYRQAHTQFSHQGKVYTKDFSVDVWGEHEAKRLALEWRVGKIREHGMEPNRELLDQLVEETAAAETSLYMRPPKPLKPVKIKQPKPPRQPRLILPKAPRLPKAPKLPKPPKLRLPKPSKAKQPTSKRFRRPKVTRTADSFAAEGTYTPTITDLPDGIVAVEHKTRQSHERAELLLDARDLHVYQLRVWQINSDGILVSGFARDQIRLHRLIAGVAPGERVTFRNGNTFDLRRANLEVSGMCRNFVGLTAHGVYPSYKGKGDNRVVRGVRAASVLPGQGKAYREFSFEKYGEADARRRAYTFRVESLQAMGQPIPADLAGELERVTAYSDHGNRSVSKQSANFFRLMSVGGALTK